MPIEKRLLITSHIEKRSPITSHIEKRLPITSHTALFHPAACTPARGRDQQSWFAGQTRNPALLEALMDLFLGPLASASTRLEITTSLINIVRGLQGKPHLVVKPEDPFKTGPFLQADADTKRQAY